jgi:predicted ATP-dependent endonuclease of OLD family
MALSCMELVNFTVFCELSMECGPGINILIGTNGTGKSHILKLLYAACDITRGTRTFPEKLKTLFMPYNGELSHLVHHKKGNDFSTITIYQEKKSFILYMALYFTWPYMRLLS